MLSSKNLPPNTASFYPTIFFRNQFCAKAQYPIPGTSLDGQAAIITGSNTGLGLECARQLLKIKLSYLILAVRNETKGQAAAQELQKQYPETRIEVWLLDMGSYPSIQSFVSRAASELARLDVVILNAGLMNSKYRRNEDTGHEDTLQVNYLSTMLLAILMLPVLKSKHPPDSPARLTISNAALSLHAKFPNRNASPLLQSFDEEATFKGGSQYESSKLLAHFFLWKLAEYVPADEIVVNLVDPGWVKGTDLPRDFDVPPVVKLLFPLIFFPARSLRDGASTYVDAVVNQGRQTHGCFIMGWKVAPFAAMCYSPEGEAIREKLWTETMAELEFAKVKDILESIGGSINKS